MATNRTTRARVTPDDTCAQQIVPTRAALAKVQKEHPNESDAQKWRLAQAQTLIDSVLGTSAK